MSLTNFPNGITSFGNIVHGGLGVGNVYYVYDTASANAETIHNRFTGQAYEDGSNILHPHTSSGTTITTNGLVSALAACVADRNDYVVVMPSANTYYTDVALTVAAKSTHFICPAALCCDVGCTNAARLQQITSALPIISLESDGCEIAGFYLKNISAYPHIQVPTGNFAWGNIIHHNYFVSRSSTTTLPMLYCLGDGLSYSRVEKNWFTSQVTGAVWTTGIISVAANAVSCDIHGNVFNAGDGTATYGVRNLAVWSIVSNNLFSEGGTGTITSCVTIGATGAVIGNRCAVATGHFSDGSGTTGVSYTDNTDGITNGATTGNLGAQLES